jgi:hypothetical protein
VLEKRNPATLHYLPAPSDKEKSPKLINKTVINPEDEIVSSQQESTSCKHVDSTEARLVESEKLHDLERLVSNSIHESMMLTGNQATILIFKLTGIMHTIDGDMFYYEGKSHESKRVYVKINGV